jgi:hypothetical protein
MIVAVQHDELHSQPGRHALDRPQNAIGIRDEWFSSSVVNTKYRRHDQPHRRRRFCLRAAPSSTRLGLQSESPGRLLALLQPAGTIEAFFRELPKYVARNASLAEMQELNRRHGTEVLGPRLPIA